jgi:hypothetical protein
MRFAPTLLLVSLASCAHPPAAQVGAPPGRAARREEPPLHADFLKLKPFRNYIQVEKVSEVADHFTVWYRQIEPCYSTYEVTAGSDGKARVREVGGQWGGMAVGPRTTDPGPDSVRALAAAVLAEQERLHRGARDVRVDYDGRYREVFVREHLLTRPLGERKRGAWWQAEIALRADEALEHVVQRGGSGGSGFGVPCFGNARSCSETPHWVESPPGPHDGALVLPRDVVPPEFVQAILATARGVANGTDDPTGRLDRILAADPDGLLPHDLAQQVELDLSIREDSPNAGSAKKIRLRFSLNEAMAAGARVFGSVRIGGVIVSYVAVLATESARPWLAATGVPLVLEVFVADDRGSFEQRRYPIDGDLIRDGPVAATRFSLDLRGGGGKDFVLRNRTGAGTSPDILLWIGRKLSVARFL